MFTNKTASYYSQDKVLIEAACLSTDTKPTTGVANGSKCIEMDTGKRYMFNEEDSEWEELPSSGGGGGTTVEALSVTQNGTYTAPSGKAYSPVTVNVSGGSSDFSTAEVTVEGSRYYTVFNLPHITEAVAILPAMIDASSSVTDGTYTVPLYKGELDVLVEGLEDGKAISTTGDIEADGNILFITGDGTITIIEEK